MTLTILNAQNRRFLGVIWLANLLGIIIAGLWSFNFWPENKVKWLRDQNGIQFYGPGIVYNEKPFTVSSFQSSVPEIQSFVHYSTIPAFQSSNISTKPFSLELWLQPESEFHGHLPHIFSMYDRSQSEIFFIGQWKSHLVLEKASTAEQAIARSGSEVF